MILVKTLIVLFTMLILAHLYKRFNTEGFVEGNSSSSGYKREAKKQMAAAMADAQKFYGSQTATTISTKINNNQKQNPLPSATYKLDPIPASDARKKRKNLKKK